jgi:hypothetical protein
VEEPIHREMYITPISAERDAEKAEHFRKISKLSSSGPECVSS